MAPTVLLLDFEFKFFELKKKIKIKIVINKKLDSSNQNI